MDDLKVYAKSDEEQKGLLKTVKGFSDDIRMELGLTTAPKLHSNEANSRIPKTSNSTLASPYKISSRKHLQIPWCE